ncbi:sugar transferase [Actinoplanes sp. NBRC 14428]|uniref:Lipopolysaccharide/colanic/teichoic acid biosynthesis glycosyltransferase n=1 Tax=Pseudosporangium ferrugineum TaxID=439699 RepID=A0A2T0S3P4_9ACTN|nr:sugar transferase [Pseudosporangium ferrugineum]PRY27923.1 lipopolysaccharide/colanic/teichoic acid biosynthesis glycosyltransferase [Pseudosporangium ferrugineum]BCJ52057.1 sugar transferase [Actinoplanes sp. NBRC 14428]
MTRRYDVVKRLADIAGAAGGLLVLSPVLLAVGCFVAVTLGRPVLFRQVRAGRLGRPFPLVKFRTMTPDGGAAGIAQDAQRMTRAGQLLRATSLDELPTLWNVLRGDMSFVGPRPLLTAYLDRYTPEQARRHEVRPGITGLAQVNGRNALGWEDKFALDVRYVDERGPALDLRILARTVRTVVARDGISGHGVPTTVEFLGSDR